MKTKRVISIILCIAALTVAVYLGFASGQIPDADSPETLGRYLGVLSLVPTVLAVALAFLTGDVILSLFAGLIIGEMMLAAISYNGFSSSIVSVLKNIVSEIAETVSDADNAKVLILCAMVGGMVGVIRSLGGFEAAAKQISRKINTPRKANLIGQLFCMLFFFDDYANALVSGPVLQPLTDKAKVSRERLSYIVDSTAAPMAGIAVVSSWVAVEISVISDGLKVAGSDMDAFGVFLKSIPYCFYCIFALVFILITSLQGREYGPMLAAERRARKGETLKEGSKITFDSKDIETKGNEKARIIIAFSCIAFLAIYALLSFIFTDGETIELLLQASLLASIVAIAAGAVKKLFTVSDGVSAYIDGASSLMPTIMVLVLAWSLAGVVSKLGTVFYVVDIISSGISYRFVPAIIFVSCCIVSFATGSYGCMFMVMPMAVPIAFAVCDLNAGIDEVKFISLCVASVLCGGIFGDHCSPMTDCTILAALGSGCETMDHVVTQMPYALTVAATSLICILLATSLTGAAVSLLAGIAAMTLIVRFVGQKP